MSTEAANARLRVMTMSDGILGGAEDLARQVAQRLDPERFESTLVATRWEPNAGLEEVLAELDAAGTGFIGMSRGSRFDLRPWRQLVREMREREIDILHTHKIGSNLWGALLKSHVPVPIFVAHEHTWSWEGQLHRRIIDRYLIGRQAAAVIAVSRADQLRMTEIEGIPAAKTRYVPVGIPTPRRERNTSEVRAELGVAPHQPLVGLVGTLRAQKNYEMMIRAALPLRREFPDLRVVIAGGEERPGMAERDRLEQLARELGVERTVTLVGYRADVFDLASSFDVGAQSSNYEGTPQSVLELMEAAKPVVATRVGGMTDMVRDGKTGLLVEPGDVDGLAEAIASLLRDPDRARAMGQAGQELRRTEFTMERMIGAVESLYEELDATARAGGAGRPA